MTSKARPLQNEMTLQPSLYRKHISATSVHLLLEIRKVSSTKQEVRFRKAHVINATFRRQANGF